ncbi:hypothetical protein F5051DRAFT_352252, partial [Lentinula edodes]
MSNNTENDVFALALLPSTVAGQIQVSSYIFSGSSAIFIWNTLCNLNADYKLLFKTKVGLPTLVYFLSRIGSMVYVIGYTVFITYPVGNCRTLNLTLNIFYPVGVPMSSLLFFFRVRAVFSTRKYIVWAFFALWLCVLASCMTIPFGGGAINIGTTRYCLTSELAPYTGAGGIVPTVHDTLVFLAISYQLLRNTHMNLEGSMKTFQAFAYGSYLPAFSKSILHDGQAYYMVTVMANLLTTIMVYAPRVSPVYRSMFSIPTVMLTNVMACYVYRNTKLGLMRDPSTLIMARSITHKDNNSNNQPLSQHIALPKEGISIT